MTEPTTPPSQGQDIPDDQAAAILEDASAPGQGPYDWAHRAVRVAYRAGYAAARDPIVVALHVAAILWRQALEGGDPIELSAEERDLVAAVDGFLAARHTLRDAGRAAVLNRSDSPSAAEPAESVPQPTPDGPEGVGGPHEPCLDLEPHAPHVAGTSDCPGVPDEPPPATPAADMRQQPRYSLAFNALTAGLARADRFVALSERETITAAVLNALDAYDAGQPWEPAEARLARGLSERGYVAPGLGGDVVANALTILDKLRVHADRLTTALDEAARDTHETVELEAVYDDGLSTDQEIRARALPEAIKWAGYPWTGIASEEQLFATVDRFAALIRAGAETDGWEATTGQRRYYCEGYAEAVRRLRETDLRDRELFATVLEQSAPDPDDPWKPAHDGDGGADGR